MELDYDRKFEEMKKYIPFLESMIKRLESTSSASTHPRQAQLDKIRSLRDLLLDKKKRMKMENLLKCEQVLVNLYAKVEQRDALPNQPAPDSKKDNKDLELVRNKLKSVTTKTEKETLPEISRASEIEETCTPGSKEPALFQRRPNKSSISPGRSTPKSPNKSTASSTAKRNYTRVLVSPDTSSRRWSTTEKDDNDIPLFSRRSPIRRSPKRYSPSRDRKKEKKKSNKQEKSKKTKGLNITLNVPEESLDSLNTKDILSRIMNCNDNDMDIETLREAKRQILSELNQTGAKYDDISDLLLKSYRNKKSNKKKSEVEEGELSDSESEAIESIYGGLNSNQISLHKEKTTDDKEQPRKIQICLVISEDGKQTEVGKTDESAKKPIETDVTDFQMYDDKVKNSDSKSAQKPELEENNENDNKEKSNEAEKLTENIKSDTNKCESSEILAKPANFYKPLNEPTADEHNKTDENKSLDTKISNDGNPNANIPSSPQKCKYVPDVTPVESKDHTITSKSNDEVEIPLLNDPVIEKPKENVVSEIDILQALKNEILSESLSIPGSDIVTPALHQPKLTKVASGQEIVNKKRISIEKYKEKSVLVSKPPTPLFVKESGISIKDDISKKQSLKLTMKECERFNFPVKLALTDEDSSDEDVDKNVAFNDIYTDIAPKSPDNDESSDVPCTPPIIIPEDPIKNPALVITSRGDVDMRTLLMPGAISKPLTSPVGGINTEPNTKPKEPVQIKVDKANTPSDPRMRRGDVHPGNVEVKPFPHMLTPEIVPQPVPAPVIYSNVTPSVAPNMTPSRNSSMTPSRTPSMTPNAKTFDLDVTRNHVYAPIYSPFERDASVAKEQIPSYTPEIDKESARGPRWESDRRDLNSARKWDDRNPRSTSVQREGPDFQSTGFGDSYKNNFNKNTRYSIDRRGEPVNRQAGLLPTPVNSFGRSDCPTTPSNPFGLPSLLDVPMTPIHPFGMGDCPPTPSHPFGRMDCPPTPIHPFGRNDCPATPSHPFGRSDCPTTPSHPFGRSDCPATPSHPFGRSECPLTPSHPFGRGDMPMTPSHPFGRSDNVPRDPRLNRSSDYDKYQKNDRERNNYYRDRNSSMRYKSDMHEKSYEGSEGSYRQHREQSVGRNDYRNDRYKYSSRDRSGQYNREHNMSRREPSVGRSGRAVSRENDNERLYSRERSQGNYGRHDYYNQNDNSRNSSEYGSRKGFYRERSVGRSGADERSYRAPSIGRNVQSEDNDNRLSVKPHAGTSFTIDTSVNSTFQDFLDTGKKIQVFDYSFDKRRQRAASVGRSLARESSVGRTFSQKSRQTFEPFENTRKTDYRRASSVGREIASKEVRNFKDIKADFELYRSKMQNNKPPVKTDSKKCYDSINDSSNRKSRKDSYDSKTTESKKPYSPRKNNRDPRLRKDLNEGKSKLDNHNRKDVGIVYSNDNITKGTILGTGYGVKNYKIPKIKRPVEEQKSETILKDDDKTTETLKKGISKTDTLKMGGLKGSDKATVKKKEKDVKNVAEKCLPERKNDDKNTKTSKNKVLGEKVKDKKTKENKAEKSKVINDTSIQNADVDIVPKRVTRLSKRSENSVKPGTKEKRTRTNKKAMIVDSEEENSNDVDSSSQTSNEKKIFSKIDESTSNSIGENTLDHQPDDQMDSSFGIDDLFSDNIVSDPVIDNIHALIADLDNDLGTNKIVLPPADFSNDIIENMLETITNQGKEDTKSLNEDEKLNDISEVINNDLNESGTSLEIKDTKSKVPVKESTTDNVNKNISDKISNAENRNTDVNLDQKGTNSLSPKDTKDNTTIQETLDNSVRISDDVVTTTDSLKAQISDKIDDKKEDQSDIDGRSTPDSTINCNEIAQNRLSQESIPDSTNEVQHEANSIVSSTHDSLGTTSKDNPDLMSSNKESTPTIDSIGSILSILQNKSKIKELLNLLGDQSSDNDKIKKKLEKLSEIVSDEEDDTKDNVDKVELTSKNIEEQNEVVNTAIDNNDTKSLNKGNDEKEQPNDEKEQPNDEKEQPNDEKEQPNDEKQDVSMEESKTDENNESNEAMKPTEETCNENKTESTTNEEETMSEQSVLTKKLPVKRGRVAKRGRMKKNASNFAKRVTRSNFEPISIKPSKKPSRELLKLQEDIKEMFMKDEILNATGIRMCRLAKLVDDKSQKEEVATSSPAPMVVIEKAKEIEALEESILSTKTGKKKTLKAKLKLQKTPDVEKKPIKVKPSKYKPGPKSKTKVAQKQDEEDPYEFESDSVSDIMNDESIDKSIEGKDWDSSDSESESLASSKSYGSSEVLSDLKKKPKRKRSSWQSGIIKSRYRKKKVETKATEFPLDDSIPILTAPITIPDLNCFTDKTYCFQKNVTTYSCRLCVYSGEDIVAHYKKHHPHSEIPLSRMNPQIAKEAIEQCEEINFQAISKMHTDKYICRFCYKEFAKKRKTGLLESFFWHVVSMHTGEYKQICSECVNVTKCPFNLDIPPPPKDVKGQLIGYICEKCNFTQISLENLKTHVIVRHNDEQTEVYTINLAAMSKKTISTLLKRYSTPNASEHEPRVLRSTRSNQSVTEASDDHSDDGTDSDHTNESLVNTVKRGKNKIQAPVVQDSETPSYQSKITFENDSDASHSTTSAAPESMVIESVTSIKVEQEICDAVPEETIQNEPSPIEQELSSEKTLENEETTVTNDIFDYPHFKISYSDTGLKEYVCCINGTESHYKTTLLISMKKHVQIKHSELWDGYCFVCKVIVTTQGQHNFKECLQHFLDKHMDNFPVLERPAEVPIAPPTLVNEPPPKPYINVRPLSELISKDVPLEQAVTEETSVMPKIESIVSLGAQTEERVPSSTSYPPPEPSNTTVNTETIPFKYEEVQATVMANKHQVVLDTMMSKEKLINVYKCAARYCSFTCDSVENSLQHASTHNRVGGEGSLSCAYCNYDCAGNAIDLVMHVFKSHGSCQYVCGYCFYRAAAGQLVTAHSAKAHPGLRPRVLSSSVPPPAATNETPNMLSREAAVRYFVCPHACKYRTYTAAKFCEHILQRHARENWHSCYICSASLASPAELVHHMSQVHQLKMYQCTWCVHGADTEPELLAHAAATHPSRQPQAYLRLITTKDGTKEFRVLPLASFNKTNIDVDIVTPSANIDHAVREAERSIELERLIGHTNLMIEARRTPDVVKEKEVRSEQPPTVAQETVPTPVEGLPGHVTPPPMSIEERSQLPTPVLKTEPQTDTPTKEDADTKKDIVYCLDSEDEDSTPAPERNVIDLSDDDAQTAKDVEKPTNYQKFPFIRLLKCPVCFCLFKNVGGFKRHTFSCLDSINAPTPCAHCGLVTKSRDDLISHYTTDHCDKESSVCGICQAKFCSIVATRKHMKEVHKINKVNVEMDKTNNGMVEYTVVAVAAAVKSSQSVKRKLSSGTDAEPPGKIKKYGPQDVDRLPINPVLQESVHCALCEFSTKVRVNMVRHLQFHAEQQPVPHSAPVNPVPHLETNEMHFDRMVNLASSSIVTRAPDRPQPGTTLSVATLVPPELAARYPALVAARHRYACGARDCSYISVDEELFKYHWNTLHASAEQFRCVHCSQTISLDSALMTANFNKITEHLKMHDATLYACSLCPFYHYTRLMIEKHLDDCHTNGKVIVVREEVETPQASAATGQPAPTMDLKPWHCGLCEFKSLLRQEIVEHCGKKHQSKMQYKCSNCPFRTSTLENVMKHMANSHPTKSDEVFYYFYREGTVPDEDGVPKWVKQRQKAGLTESSEIKTEVAEPTQLALLLSAPRKPPILTHPIVDLNIVKTEVESSFQADESIEALCKKYGNFCDPNGLNYKCPLCQVVMEDTRDAMQSHLYEELRYRRWMCGTCSYKAFHSAGLSEHIISEHRGQNQKPVQLPSDLSIEKWVSAFLDHQTAAIVNHRDTLAKQKIITERPPRPSKPEEPKATQPEKVNPTKAELEKTFGPLGMPSNMAYSCPKCNMKIKDESTMRNHLESELTKIRWCCSQCSGTFHTYHEAQFHCKSAHAGHTARPREAERSPALRSAWLQAVMQVQKLSMRCLPLSSTEPDPPTPQPPPVDTADNSLLVVRYEERVPAPEEVVPPPRHIPPSPSPDSDDERLIIDEYTPTTSAIAKKSTSATKCPHCDYQSKYAHVVYEHTYRHYNIKPFTCALCDFQGHKGQIQYHLETVHGLSYRSDLAKRTELPTGPPLIVNLVTRLKKDNDENKLVCLVCEKTLSESEQDSHRHPDTKTEFVKKGKVVVKCGVCSGLFVDMDSLRTHFHSSHPDTPINYAFHKPNESKDLYCGHCQKRFSFMRDLRAHNTVHSPLALRYTTTRPSQANASIVLDDDESEPETSKRKSVDNSICPAPKRIAKKSTTKLPVQRMAKKSTTKLPFHHDDSDSEEEFSFYGTKPTPLREYKNVTTMMSFCNTMVPFTVEKLSDVIKIDPSVVVRDLKKPDINE